MTLPQIDRAAGHATDSIVPPRTAANAPFWQGLQNGILVIQRCRACDLLRFPIAPVCPHCGGGAFSWRTMSGGGTVFSWVRYHRSYIPEFEDLLPYSVLLVELEEGVRIFGRYLSAESPAIGDRVQVVVERWADNVCVPVFAPVGEKA